ncbi:ABC transporter permease [Lacticaseibacillus songhuajiangensis]|uniref:ABC transporter permease n=1 Tax=Lacticaseibacillus songhuajiangensis TaxID=1296539 RepID=UPI000F7A2FC7|nr:ABC transporter permease [Lacticaseibacillus songhuajiangensis]
MNFAKRAWLNLIGRKGRSILLVLVTSAIMLFVLAGILLRGAANEATQNAKDSVGASLTLTANRQAAFKKMRSSSTGTPGTSGTKPKLTMSSVKLSDAKKIDKLSDVNGYTVSVSTSANAKGFSAISTSSSSSQGGPGGMMQSSGDISVSGVTGTASSSKFSDGTYKITSGRNLTAKDAGTQNVVIESELASENNLKVGSTIKLKATTGTKKTYTLKVVGIYKAKSSASTTGMPGQSDPANTVFTSYTFANTLKGSKYKNTADSVEFTVSAPGKVSSVKAAAKKLINTSKFALESDDANYRMVKQSMSSVTSFANKIVWLVAIAGTIILALIVILMIRERRYEIGVLLSLGEKRWKIIAQFFTELLVVLLIGIGVAGIGGKFVGDKLGESVISSQTSTFGTAANKATLGGMQGGKTGGPSGQAPSGGSQQMPGSSSSAKSQQTTTKVKTHVSVKYMLELLAFGILIILLAIFAGAGSIMSLQPKKVLIG